MSQEEDFDDFAAFETAGTTEDSSWQATFEGDQSADAVDDDWADFAQPGTSQQQTAPAEPIVKLVSLLLSIDSI